VHDEQFARAVKSWCEALGHEHVVLKPEQLTSAATATFHTERVIRAILRPANRHQVQDCIRVANDNKTPIYPISRGKNWGYGSAVPTADDCALLDLRRLDRITEYDEKLGTIRLEPGVTQQQLYVFLMTNGNKFWMDATGSSPNSSIVGNTLERGFGHSPYADHFAHTCDLEVVLPDGDCIRTGLGRFKNAKAAAVSRWGVGPYVDGLFTQSNLGVVTQMTVWLMPAPEHYQSCYFSIERDDQLPELIDTVGSLRLKGVINNALHIGNDYRVISSIRQYPWEETGDQTPLPRTVLDDLGKRWEFGAWNGAGALYGTRRQVAEARRQIKRALKGRVRKLRFVSDTSLHIAKRLQRPLEKLTGWDVPTMLRLVYPVHEMMKGKPTERFIASAYWRKRRPIPSEMNPDRDGCGLIWCTPVSPIDGREARTMVDLANDVLLSHGFEPGMTLTLLSARCMENVIGIVYDRAVDGEDERAMTCYRTLLGQMTKHGFYPYRLGTQSMLDLVSSDDPVRQRFLQTLKTAIDGNGILAPNRYL
jgi:4-cresol dehydrogenase (hydroxylating)